MTGGRQMWEPHCCFHLEKCQHQWGMTSIVTVMTSGTAGQLVPAQAAQRKVVFCREEELGSTLRFFAPERQAQDAQHCAWWGFWHSFSGSNYFELFLKLWPCISDYVSVKWDAFFDILIKSLTFTQEKTFCKFKSLQAFAVKKEIPEPAPSGKPLKHCF